MKNQVIGKSPGLLPRIYGNYVPPTNDVILFRLIGIFSRWTHIAIYSVRPNIASFIGKDHNMDYQNYEHA